jgi:DNA sulfur modification protein DndD
MCYYGKKSFDFSDGLNIILGWNGDGKSTIFTAFNWIFNSTQWDLSKLYSHKEYAKILDGEDFDVSVECVVTQYEEEYKISKTFNVTKNSVLAKISTIKEEIVKRNLGSGEIDTDYRTISDLSRQVFPEAFRNFSMFETETDALKIIEGKQLAELVKSFSNAKYYDKLDRVISGFALRADKQFRRESNADENAQKQIEDIDAKIKQIEGEIERLENRIDEDEKGQELYTEKITELVKSLSISEEYKEIEEQINKLNKETESARSEIKRRNKFTEFLFDKMYFLVGFENIMNDYSTKIDDLRQKKNSTNSEELSKYAVEKLELENGATPFPPGFPSLEILNEIKKDGICKICGEPLTDKAKIYIDKSINLYNESKKNKTEIKAPIIFPNNFIDELQIIDRTFQLHSDKYSKDRIESEIQFNIKRITESNAIITNNTSEIELKEKEIKEILAKAPNLSADEIKNAVIEHAKYSNEKSELERKIGENNARLESKNTELQESKKTRSKTLSQFRESNFKKSTVDLLEDFSEIAKVVKDKEYDNFLKKLSDKATQYLKQINVGEITGKIKLHKKGDEVKFLSVNEDDTMRYDLENSGALQISIPLSILFAIADIAAETVDNESYPMIFDAPTGRFSPDRERAFFRVLKETKKQRIVVTKQFLDGDENENIIPYVKQEEFQKIARDRAFFIKRTRPFDKNNKATIDTHIEQLTNKNGEI